MGFTKIPVAEYSIACTERECHRGHQIKTQQIHKVFVVIFYRWEILKGIWLRFSRCNFLALHLYGVPTGVPCQSFFREDLSPNAQLDVEPEVQSP